MSANKQTEIIMGMPITVEIVDKIDSSLIKKVFDYFRLVDQKFSTYKKDSEITAVNNGLDKSKWSKEMKKVIDLCEETKRQTKGYFNILNNGKIDPSGLVKGWSIHNAAKLLKSKNVKNFFIDAGGDIQIGGHNSGKTKWLIGIRNPFNIGEIIKIIALTSEGVATSGLYIRGDHIYNPLTPNKLPTKLKSLTVIGPNIYDADRFATAAFAMDTKGIEFIESHPHLEGYAIDDKGIATFTSGFSRYVANYA